MIWTTALQSLTMLSVSQKWFTKHFTKLTALNIETLTGLRITFPLCILKRVLSVVSWWVAFDYVRTIVVTGP